RWGQGKAGEDGGDEEQRRELFHPRDLHGASGTASRLRSRAQGWARKHNPGRSNVSSEGRTGGRIGGGRRGRTREVRRIAAPLSVGGGQGLGGVSPPKTPGPNPRSRNVFATPRRLSPGGRRCCRCCSEASGSSSGCRRCWFAGASAFSCRAACAGSRT